MFIHGFLLVRTSEFDVVRCCLKGQDFKVGAYRLLPQHLVPFLQVVKLCSRIDPKQSQGFAIDYLKFQRSSERLQERVDHLTSESVLPPTAESTRSSSLQYPKAGRHRNSQASEEVRIRRAKVDRIIP